MINIGIGIGWAKAIYSVANNVIANFKARVLSYPGSIFEAGPCLDTTLEELNAIGLLDNASLVITPNAYNEGILYDVVPNTTLGDMNVVRATTATRVNEQGLVEVVPYNLLGYSQEFENAYWAKTGVTITPDVIVAPNGTLTGDAFVLSLTTSLHKIRKDFSFVAGNNYTASIYAKKGSQDFIQIKMSFSAFGGAWRIATFNLNTGVVVSHNSNSGILPTITNVGNGWYRCTFTCLSTASISDEYSYQISDFNFTGDGSIGFYIWGSQLVINTIPQTYFPTTTRLNIPRIDYTNGSCPSILVEPQRTNLVTYSNDFSNVAWLKNSITITGNQSDSPSSFELSNLFVPNATVGNRYLARNIDNATKLFSIYLKKKELSFVKLGTANAVVVVDLENGTLSKNTDIYNDYSILNVQNGWYRVNVYNKGLLAQIQIFGGINSIGANISTNGTDGFYIYGAQLEAGTYQTSYIPTVASTVTRNADVISKTGISSLIGQTEGTVFVDLYSPFDGTSKQISLSDGTLSNRISIGFLNQVDRFTIQVIKNNVIQVSNTFVSVNEDIRNKIVLSYEQNNYKLYINGVLSLTDTLAETFTNELSILQLNRGNDQYPYFGDIKSIQLYKTALTDAECITLTTL